jgi:hypothetical protein
MRSFFACKAVKFAEWMVPFTIPGGKPVTAVPGWRPTLPSITLGPVLVTVAPASTAKAWALPSPAWARRMATPQRRPATIKAERMRRRFRNIERLLRSVDGER